MLFSDHMFISRDELGIALPVIGIKCTNGEAFELLQQSLTRSVGSLTVVMRKNCSTHALHDIPRPSLIGFVAYITPEFIPFDANIHPDFGVHTHLHIFGVGDIHLSRLFVFECRQHRRFGAPEIATNIAYATAAERLCFDWVFDTRHPGSIGIFQLKAPAIALTEIALRPVFAMSIFDEIIMLTMRTRKLSVLEYGLFLPSVSNDTTHNSLVRIVDRTFVEKTGFASHCFWTGGMTMVEKV